jgi:sugar O-acyltransferase (sialic acid O-acetyltransferase NeuD family)
MAGVNSIRPVVIIGAGGLGREVLEILKARNRIVPEYEILGFIDDNKETHGKAINGYRSLGGLDWLKGQKGDGLGCICAIGACATRKKVVQKLQEMDLDFFKAIHPSVVMGDFIELGRGVIIGAGSVLTVNIRIEDHVFVNKSCSIGHDVTIGRYCSINTMTTVSGGSRLQEGVYIGAGATLVQEVSVGSWATIGAGAAVIDDIPGGVVAVGVPARPIRDNTATDSTSE